MDYKILHKLQIAEIRSNTFAAHFPKETKLRHLLKDHEAVSEWEDENEGPPKRIRAVWRSVPMENIIKCVDRLAYVRARGRVAKENVRRVLERNGERLPRNEEVDDWTHPKNFPIDAFSEDYINLVGKFHITEATTGSMNLASMANEMVKGVFGEKPTSFALIQKGTFGSNVIENTGSANLGKRRHAPRDNGQGSSQDTMQL